MISFDGTICTDFHAATSREWLETNGLGGFASGTISGANSRRYHGIFTPATKPPLGRITTISKLEETFVVDAERFELSANQYPGRIHPQGYLYLKSFKLDPFPVWTFEFAGVRVEKKIFMPHGQNTVAVSWRVTRGRVSPKIVSLQVRPLVSFADYHHLRHEDPDFQITYHDRGGILELSSSDGAPAAFLHHTASSVSKTGFWYRDFEYEIERERGFDFHEDLFQPFALVFDDVRSASVIISSEELIRADAAKLERAEIRRRASLVTQSRARDEFTRQLVLAADQFVVARGKGHTIIAGYPWFSDWGRDTMIALAGLTLATRRPEIAGNILLEYSKHISEGMIPNRFPDAGSDAEYNTVDATLWYFEAIRAYAAHTGDIEFIREHLYEKLVDIVTWHLRGTRFKIHVDTDGLLCAGEAGVQLTWMDAKIGDLVITPRTGKPVEIQALWYNALCIMADLAERFGDLEDRKKYLAMADLAKLSFNALFWNAEEACLYDVIDDGERDESVRPNQILAISLPHSMVGGDRAKQVVDKVEADLLTPVGLRSLSPRDKRYVPIYEGSPFDRDSGYHQGTVWGWLIGPFVDAYRRVYPDREARVKEMLSGFESHLTEAGLGQISEIFDGDAPHLPRGCPAQAWSVAEVLRVKAGQTLGS